MARLIDADKLSIDFYDEYETEDDAYAYGYVSKHQIDTAPSIDIVRCGECMHNGSYDTDCPFGWRNGEWNLPKPCDFCSYGELMKGADDETD